MNQGSQTLNQDLAIILTARMGSERLPGKAMLDVRGTPLIGWVIKRLSKIGRVILATTRLRSDDPLAAYARTLDVPVFRGQQVDVVSRMDDALKQYHPEAKWVLRGLGDCPFMAGELIARAMEICEKQGGDIMQWALAPHVQPLYGSREFPYSRAAWERIVQRSTAREHVDVYFHSNRDQFKVIYHEPPKNYYFRGYRVEVDWPEDIAMLRALAGYVSPMANLERLVQVMDKHPEIMQINHGRVERTGPSTYPYEVLRSWYENMSGQPVVGWDNTVWNTVSGGEPVFCDGGTCLIGFSLGGIVQTRAGDLIRGDARIACSCGVGRRWSAKS